MDALRAQAFGQRAPEPLTQVYGSPVLLQQDATLLLTLVPTGCGLTGLRTTFEHLELARTAAGYRITAGSRA